MNKNEESLFEGDIKKDKEYFLKYQGCAVRYFELKEIKVSEVKQENGRIRRY